MIAFSSNFVFDVLGCLFSGVATVMIGASIPFELSLLNDEEHYALAIPLNTIVSSIAGIVSPMLLAVTGIEAGMSSFYAGAALSILVTVVLLLTKLGSKIQDGHSKIAA